MLQLGLLDRAGTSHPSCGIKLERPLGEIIEQSTGCWACAWLWLLVQSRQTDILTAIPEGGRTSVYLGIESHYNHTFEQGRSFSDSSKDERVLLRILHISQSTRSRKSFP